MASVVRASEVRRTETPNGVMCTLASPTLGHSSQLSVWRVFMAEGQRGPWHVCDSEQLFTVVTGGATVSLEEEEVVVLEPRDTVVLPGGRQRQIAASGSMEAIVAGFSRARVTVPGEDGDRGTPPWIA